MAEKSRNQLKNFFKTEDKPTQEQFSDLIDSFLHKKDDNFTSVNFLEFTGRFYLYKDKRWVGTHPYYGQAYCNHYYSHGIGATPKVVWSALGIGFLPKGTILHRLEFVGRANSAQVKGIQIQLSCQGANLEVGDVGYDSITEAENKVILPPTDLESSAPNFADIQRHVIQLEDFELDSDRIIVFTCRGIGDLTATRYWMAQRQLYYTLPKQ